MPEISRFYGIIIAMFFDEHNPLTFMQDMVNIKYPSELEWQY